MLQTIHSMRGYGSGGAASSSTRGGGDGDEDDVAMQVGGLGRCGMSLVCSEGGGGVA